MLTPVEIRQQSFKKTFRGYDKVEVDAFMQEVANAFEQQLEENRRQKEELQKIKASYETLKEVENMLHKTLMQAEQSSRSAVENARHKAELKLQEAEAKAREIVQRGISERDKIQRELDDLHQRQEEILTQLQVFLQSQLGRLESFERRGLPPANGLVRHNGHGHQDSLFGQKDAGKAALENNFYDDLADEL